MSKQSLESSLEGRGAMGRGLPVRGMIADWKEK